MLHSINNAGIKLFLSLVLFNGTLSAQLSHDTGTIGKIFLYGFRFHYTYFWPHSRSIAPIGEAYPWGLQAEFKWLHTGEKTWQQCNCYPQTGFHFTYFNFSKPKILGEGITATWFIEPFFSFHHHINFSLRGGAGLAWLTTPYDSLGNPMNFAYSMNINGFVMIHLALNYRINRNLSANLTANINHLSNGGVRQPNKGINFPGATLDFDYAVNPIDVPRRGKTGFAKKNKQLRKDFCVFFSGKTIVREDDIYYPVYGSALQLSKQVGKISALSGGVDWIIDFALRRKLENSNRGGTDYIRGGVLIGHEFLMGCFSLSQQLGVYLYDPSKMNDPVYQRYGLIYKPGKHLFFGINVKSHRHIADFMDGRIGWSF